MATTFTTPHTFELTKQPAAKTLGEIQLHGKLRVFVDDLIEDLQQRPLQPAHLAKHDMFREHINAMSISYFALILLLIASSLPMLAYLVPWQAL
jgi:hypothetical protein